MKIEQLHKGEELKMRNSNFKYYKFLGPKTSEKRESNETDAKS